MSSESASKLADGPANSARQRDAVGAESVGGGLDRAIQHPGTAAVERVDTVDLGQPPRQPVTVEAQPGEERRADGHRVDRRAVVVQQAGQDRLAAAGAAADLVGGFQHGHLTPARARVTAAARPFGPAPTTIAVLMRGPLGCRPARCC